MPHLMLKAIPRYECLLETSRLFPDLDPSACEAFLHLLRAGDEAYAQSEQYLTAFGMTPGRFTVLMQLYDKRAGRPVPQTPADLAERAGVTRATMTGLIDTMVRDGLVTREHDSGDRRMMRIHLTARGHDVIRSLLPGYFKQVAVQMAGLSEEERKTLVRLLNKIAVEAPVATVGALPAGAA